MKTVTIQLYSIDELCEESRKRAYERWLAVHDYTWADEVRDTMNALEREFDAVPRDWQYDASSHWFGGPSFGPTWTGDRLSLSGNRARAYLWSNFGHLLLEPRTAFRGKLRFRSRVIFDRVYDGTCPMTGVSFDNDALDPLAYFCFGVKWDEKEGKRVMVPHDERWKWASTTVEDVIRDCFDALLKAAQEDCRYHESFEYFTEECEANEWTFERDGRMRNA